MADFTQPTTIPSQSIASRGFVVSELTALLSMVLAHALCDHFMYVDRKSASQHETVLFLSTPTSTGPRTRNRDVAAASVFLVCPSVAAEFSFVFVCHLFLLFLSLK